MTWLIGAGMFAYLLAVVAMFTWGWTKVSLNATTMPGHRIAVAVSLLLAGVITAIAVPLVLVVRHDNAACDVKGGVLVRSTCIDRDAVLR